MPANGRDIAVFFLGLAAAGLAPIVIMPTLELRPMLAQFGTMTGDVPLQHVGVVLLVALLAAAWIDTSTSAESDWK